jgi:hypothetical protein
VSATVGATIEEAKSVHSVHSDSNGMSQHLTFLQHLTSKPFSEVEVEHRRAKEGRAIVHRKAVRARVIEDVYIIADLVPEVMYLDAKETVEHTIYRVFVASKSGGAYCDLGWVLKEEVSHCMLCKLKLTVRNKNHCKACGDVCCSNCCDKFVDVIELQSSTPCRVCKVCYKGEVSD